MKYKALWTNYKIYGIIIGIALGVIVYNSISMDFSICQVESVKKIDWLEAYMFFLIMLLRFYICILLISFLKIKDKLYVVALGVEAFKISGIVVAIIKVHNMILGINLIDAALKIFMIYLFQRKEKTLLNKMFALFVVLIGSLIEIFLINFF